MTNQQSYQHFAEMRELWRSWVSYRVGCPGVKGKKCFRYPKLQAKDVSVSLSLPFSVWCAARFDLQLLY